MPGEPEQKRQQYQQHQRKTAIFQPDYCKNADNTAGVGKHADNARGKQALHRVHIAHEPGNQCAGLLMIQGIGSQANLLCHQAAAERMGYFLTEDGEQSLSCRLGKAGERG